MCDRYVPVAAGSTERHAERTDTTRLVDRTASYRTLPALRQLVFLSSELRATKVVENFFVDNVAPPRLRRTLTNPHALGRAASQSEGHGSRGMSEATFASGGRSGQRSTVVLLCCDPKA